MFKSALVFLHLLAFAWAFAPIVRTDLMMWRARKSPLTRRQYEQLSATENDAIEGLFVLWVSGLILVALGYGTDGMRYLMNEKLWMKVVVVVALTFNGFALHSKVFPLLHRDLVFIDLPLRQRLLAAALGAVSGTSWIFAAYLGIARFLNNTAPFFQIFSSYLMLLAGAVVFAMLSQLSFKRRGLDRALS